MPYKLADRWVLKFHMNLLPQLSGYLHPTTAAAAAALGSISAGI